MTCTVAEVQGSIWALVR